MKTKMVLAGLLTGALMLGTACRSDEAAMRGDEMGPGTGGAGNVGTKEERIDEERPIDPSAGPLQGAGISGPKSDIMRYRVRDEIQLQQEDSTTLDDEQDADKAAQDEDRQVRPED